MGNKRPYVLLGLVLALITVQLFRTWWRLRHIPGPFLAKFTNLQRVWWVKTKRADLIHKRLHEQYGEVVRMGPNMVSFSNPAAVPVVYPFGPGMQKVCSPSFFVPLRKETANSAPTICVERLVCNAPSLYKGWWCGGVDISPAG